jgi:UDP-glucose 4-epimerase
MFDTKIKLLPSREGERYASALTNISSNDKIYRVFGKLNLKEYIADFRKKFQ